jgi:radical SAM superfamily enzyme YgiQ (UPF0313 family)
MPDGQGLRRPGSILLVACYELGHQPLSVAAPAASLAAAGFSPRLLDLSKSALDPALVREARLAAISVPMHTALAMGVRAARQIRAIQPDCRICLYGHYAGLNAPRLLGQIADFTVAGTCETALVDLAVALERGTISELAGVSVPGRFANPRLSRPGTLVPDRAALPALDSYVHLLHGDESRKVGYVEATQGCKHHCLHCPIPPIYSGRFRAVPKERVLADIAQLIAAGAGHITFGDPDFLNGPAHSLAIVDALHAAWPCVTYDFTAKIEHLLRHAGRLRDFQRTGCRFIVTAVESLSDTVLQNLQKGHTRADVFATFSLAREARIPLRPSLLPFTPWSSLEDYLDLIDWLVTEGLATHADPIQLAIRLLIPEGSSLLGTPQFEPYRGDWDEERMTWSWSHPDSRMDSLQREVMGIVEAAPQRSESAGTTVMAIRRAAYRAAGRPLPAEIPRNQIEHVPRLSEPWFC